MKKRPDLLLLVAIWQFLIAFFCLVGIAAISVFAFPEAVDYHGLYRVDVGAIFGLTIAILFLLGCLGVSVAGGLGILLGKAWGRIVSIINAIFSLFFFPVGTVIGVLILIYLMSTQVREYFESSPD